VPFRTKDQAEVKSDGERKLVKLLTQPGAGSTDLVDAINSAVKTIEIVIFRFDRREIEAALKAAAARGVFVHALVTYRNRGGEKNLRKLEMRLLDAGVTVARTSNDLVRYHDKFLIKDREELFLLAFNFTAIDIDHSRSFALVSQDSSLVQEAGRLFEADCTRQPFTPQTDALVVSPINARRQLAEFIEGAREELLIYDPKISDPQMIRLLKQQSGKGVQLRIIGRVGRAGSGLAVRKSSIRLHCRAMVRDGVDVFVGSQSLREEELDERREVGLIVSDPAIAESIRSTFDTDWDSAAERAVPDPLENHLASSKKFKKAVKALVKDLPPLSDVVKEAVQQAADSPGNTLDAAEVKETVKEAVKEAVKEGVKQAVKAAVEDSEDIA
jgi:phosphatidylserine/phosphatidylglycerophosphate/cardiolipin synthase-like enzyme